MLFFGHFSTIAAGRITPLLYNSVPNVIGCAKWDSRRTWYCICNFIVFVAFASRTRKGNAVRPAVKEHREAFVNRAWAIRLSIFVSRVFVVFFCVGYCSCLIPTTIRFYFWLCSHAIALVHVYIWCAVYTTTTYVYITLNRLFTWNKEFIWASTESHCWRAYVSSNDVKTYVSRGMRAHLWRHIWCFFVSHLSFVQWVSRTFVTCMLVYEWRMCIV